MGSRLRVGGNAVQPLLLMFPLGLLAVAFIFDVSSATGAPALLGTLGYYTVIAALVGGSPAVAALWIDAMAAQHRGAEALRLLVDLAVLVLFAVVVLLRMRTPDRTAGAGLLGIESLGLLLAAFGGWFGERLGGWVGGCSSARRDLQRPSARV